MFLIASFSRKSQFLPNYSFSYSNFGFFSRRKMQAQNRFVHKIYSPPHLTTASAAFPKRLSDTKTARYRVKTRAPKSNVLQIIGKRFSVFCIFLQRRNFLLRFYILNIYKLLRINIYFCGLPPRKVCFVPDFPTERVKKSCRRGIFSVSKSARVLHFNTIILW